MHLTSHATAKEHVKNCAEKIGRKFCEKNALEPALECGASKRRGKQEAPHFRPIFLKQGRRSCAPAQWAMASPSTTFA